LSSTVENKLDTFIIKQQDKIRKFYNTTVQPTFDAVYYYIKISLIIFLILLVGYIIYRCKFCWLLLGSSMKCPTIPCFRRNNRRHTVGSIFSAPNKTPYITIGINDEISARCLVDTGSVFSIIDSKVYAKLKSCRVHPAMVTPIAANGSPIPMLGTIFVNVKFADVDEVVVCYIQEGCTSEFIMGINFLNRFKNVSFLFSKSAIRFLNVEVPCSTMTYNAPTDRGVVSVDSNLIIKPRTIIRTTVPVSALYSEVDMVQFEPFLIDKSPKIYLASSISSVENGRIPIQVLSLSDHTETIRPSVHLGRISRYVPETADMPITETEDILKYIQQCAKFSPMLNKNQRKILLNLLGEFPTLYSRSEKETGKTDLVHHVIQTNSSLPIRKLPFRTSPKEKEIITKEVEALQQHGIIRPSSSPWATNVVLVRKRDGRHRLCVDFRALNKITKRDVYPLPRIDDILDTLSGMKYFTTLDQANAYWSLPINEADKEKTAFTSPTGLFEFNFLPFGLSNAPSTFQRLMDLLLSGLKWKSCMVYLDDVLVFAADFEQMIFRLREVLKRLSDGGMKLRLEKCKFCETEVTYLGHTLSAAGIKPDMNKLKAVKDIPTPVKSKDVKSFLGLVSYYRKFIPSCSQICQPLIKLLANDTKFVWLEEQQIAFDKLKRLLVSPPLLAHPNFSKKFYVHTDASYDGIGGILSQIGEDGKDHPICYASRTLRPAEKNYGVTELETLAVVEFVKLFRPYLYQQDVTVVTDHQAVKSVLEKSNVNPRIARWGLSLSGVNLTVVPRKGTKHSNADALSRLPDVKAQPVFDIETDMYNRPALTVGSISAPTVEDLVVLQKKDPFSMKILKQLEAHKYVEGFVLKDDLLFKDDGGILKLVVPLELCKCILVAFHDDKLSGHFGAKKTFHLISKRYFWPFMLRDITNYCKTCSLCQLNKPTRHKFKADLHPIRVTGPFERLAVDCMGPFPLTIAGNRFIVVFIDHFSKFIEAFATSDITAQTIAKLFVENIICKHGAPQILQTDRGSDFTSNLMVEVTKIFDIRKVLTSPYHPIANGEVERSNQTLIARIRMFIDRTQEDWDLHLPFAVFSTNIHMNETTKFSPFEVIYGRVPKLPIDSVLSYSPKLHFLDLDLYSHEVKKHFAYALRIVQQNIYENQDKYKEFYDRSKHNVEYAVGDLILKESQVRKPGISKKLLPLYDGPYRVVSVKYPNIEVQLLSDSTKREVIHVNRTKRFYKRLSQEISDQSTLPVPDRHVDKEDTLAVQPSHTYNLRSRC